MPDVVFCCPHCQHVLIVDAQGIGLQVPCPRCQAGIDIPATAVPEELIQRLAVEPAPEPARPEPVPAPVAAGPGGAPPDSTEGDALIRSPSRGNLLMALVLLAFITAGLVLALFVQSRTGFTPPETLAAVFSGERAITPAAPGREIELGPLRLLVTRLRTEPSGGPGQPAHLHLEVTLRNGAKHPVDTAYLWGDTRLVSRQHSIRPVPSLESAVPPPLAPGEERRELLSFPLPDSGRESLSVLCFPGAWFKAATGVYSPVTRAGFLLPIDPRPSGAPARGAGKAS